MIATEGWTQTTSLPAVEAIKRLTGRGVRSFVYTDVSRDGMLTGVDLDARQAASPARSAAASCTRAGSARSTTCARSRGCARSTSRA